MAQVHYARAQQLAYPNATKRVAGPFETRSEAWEAAARLRPRFPGCNVTAHVETVPLKKLAQLLGGPRIPEPPTVP